MKFRKMLPAAAGVIALTSSIAFAHGGRGLQEEHLRTRVSGGESNSDTKENAPASLAIDSESGNVYHVRLVHGETAEIVLVDVRTGESIRRG